MGGCVSSAAWGAGSHPVTTTLPILLEEGSDGKFRRFLYDFRTVADRMNALRDHFARQVGITGPQYTLLMAVMQLGNDAGVPPRQIANHLRVTAAFVALESGRLVRAGILSKRNHPTDGRSTLLAFTPRGRRMMQRLIPEVRSVNDLFFARLDAKTFRVGQQVIERLLKGSRLAMAHIDIQRASAQDAQ